MQSFTYLVSVIFDLYLMVVILRFWLQLARADFYNPFSQFVVKATNPVVAPLRRIIPGFAGIDWASLLFAFVVVLLKWLIIILLVQGSTISIGELAYISAINLIKEIGMIVFWVLLLQAILSWVSQGRSPIEHVLHQLTEPLLSPIRRVIPAIGGLDLSVLIMFIALQFINMLLGETLPLWSQI